jgi:hypothetical protein
MLLALAGLLAGCHWIFAYDPASRDQAVGWDAPLDARAPDLRRPDLRPRDLRPLEKDAGCCPPWPDPPRFDTPVPVSEVNDPSSHEQEPFLTAEGLTLFFFSDRPGGLGGTDLYFVERSSPEASFGPVQRYDSLNTEWNEWRLVITADNLTAYLTTDRPGGKGGSDIWVGTRASPTVPFASQEFRPVSELNLWTRSTISSPRPTTCASTSAAPTGSSRPDGSAARATRTCWSRSEPRPTSLLARRSPSPVTTVRSG